MSCTELTAGFPTTTVTSLTSLSTGLPAGQHGLPGYTTYLSELDEVVNWLAWQPVGRGDDLRERIVPEELQPQPTVWEMADAAGVAVTVASSRHFEGSGLTRAVFRGGQYAGIVSGGDSVAVAASAADRGHRSLVYCYISELDLIGHVRGPESEAWVAQLALVDRQAEALAARLPQGTTLLVTSDHGMASMPAQATIDADEPGSVLRDGVVALAGEPRMRHIHVRPGATDDVLAAWSAVVGDRAWLLTRAQAIEAGLFGPVVVAAAEGRIGDVLCVARDDLGIVQRRRESRLSTMPGHHGSLTDIELLVPLLCWQC
jgi:hypothetical protein